MRDSYEIKENGRTDPAVIKHGIKLKQKLRKFGFLNNLLFLTKVKKKKKKKKKILKSNELGSKSLERVNRRKAVQICKYPI